MNYEIIHVAKVREDHATTFTGVLTGLDIYTNQYKSQDKITPFTIPETTIAMAFLEISNRFQHNNDGIFIVNASTEDARHSITFDLCIKDNRIVGINKRWIFPERRAKLTEN